MQKFIPNYDKKKAFSIDEDDFLHNVPKEEIGERLTDMISDFHKELNTDGKKSVLLRMLKRIKKYSDRLSWDPTDWLRKTTGKDYESLLKNMEE